MKRRGQPRQRLAPTRKNVPACPRQHREPNPTALGTTILQGGPPEARLAIAHDLIL